MDGSETSTAEAEATVLDVDHDVDNDHESVRQANREIRRMGIKMGVAYAVYEVATGNGSVPAKALRTICPNTCAKQSSTPQSPQPKRRSIYDQR